MIQSFIEQTTALYASREQSFVGLVKAAGLSPALDFQMRDLSDLPLAGEDVAGFNFTGSRLEGSGIEQAINLDKAILIDATFKAGSPLIIKAFEQKLQGLEFIEAATNLVEFLNKEKINGIELFFQFQALFSLLPEDLRADIWFYKTEDELKSIGFIQNSLLNYIILQELKDFIPEHQNIFQKLSEILEKVINDNFLIKGSIAISNSLDNPERKLKKIFKLFNKYSGSLEQIFKDAKPRFNYYYHEKQYYDYFGGRGLRAIRAYVSHIDKINIYDLIKYLDLKTKGNYLTLTNIEKAEIIELLHENVKNEKDENTLAKYVMLFRKLND